MRVFLFFCCLSWGVCLTSSYVEIPEYLRECYTKNSIENSNLPMNLQTIIDIIRKAESYSFHSMDMRTFATSLLRRYKFDGIEFHEEVVTENNEILPYAGTGYQRTKHSIIEDLIPGDPAKFPSEVLSLSERCTLHFAISNTVWTHDLPNNRELCSDVGIEKITGRGLFEKLKNCPKEFGVIMTPIGTVSLGSVINAIAASLQPQNVSVAKILRPKINDDPGHQDNDESNFKFNEDEVDLIVPKQEMSREMSMSQRDFSKSLNEIDNVWLTTVAGELAEMVVFQGLIVGPEMTLGATGFWNSTMRPAIYYLTERYGNFDATRAELIGDIDGLIIARNLKLWLEKLNSLRLSQILEMYYLNFGINFDTNIKACQRGKSFLMNSPDTVLEEQTYAISQVLMYRKSIGTMTEETLKKMVGYATSKFHAYTNNNIFPEEKCRNEKVHPIVEVFVAFDGSWQHDYFIDFLSVFIQDLDVSMFGSRIGLLHGTTGNWIFNVTNSTASAHEAVSNLTKISWPLGMNYTKVLETIYLYLNDTWFEESNSRNSIGNIGQAVLVLAPRVFMNQQDKNSALIILRRIKLKFPDFHFLYYITEANRQDFQQFLISEEDHLITSLNIDDIIKNLLKVPRILRPLIFGRDSKTAVKPQIENYISPTQEIIYKLHSSWKQKSKEITVTVHNFGYGTLKICAWNEYENNDSKVNYRCKDLSVHEDANFTESSICHEQSSCPSTFYSVGDVVSYHRCAEFDCRTPDQVRYIIRLKNLYYKNSASEIISNFHFRVVIFIAVTYKLLF